VVTDERTLPPAQRLQYDLGQRFSEMNTILRRIRKRRSGEPTAQEKARLATLREEIHALKRTGVETP
jgi:hypothetical protein